MSRPVSTASSDMHLYLDGLRTAHPDIKFIRIYWMDLSSIPRARVFPIQRVIDHLAHQGEFSIGITKAWTGLMPNDTFIGDSAAGEYLLFPDWASLRYGPRPGHISVQGEFRENDGSLCDVCPRTQLRQIIEKSGLDFRIGFELEFMILNKSEDGSLKTEYQGSWSYGRALDTGYAEKIVEPAIQILTESGIEVEQYHAEAASSQYELILAHRPVMEAIDNLLHAREVLRALALKNNLIVTFHPKFVPSMCGSGCHVHMSVQKDGRDIPEYESFYAGILRDLPAILAFTYASPASYLRMKDLYWAGGTTVAWGTQDREAALRKIAGAHWEMKTMDGLANPYLAIAAILVSGVRGYYEKLPLDIDDSTRTGSVDSIDGVVIRKERKELPRTLPDALKALQGSALSKQLSEQLIHDYIMVKKTEVGIYAPMTLEKMNQFICARY